MNLTKEEIFLKEVNTKAKGHKCLIHNLAASITLQNDEVLVQTCCKAFGDEIEEICGIVQGQYVRQLHNKVARG